ncbi:amidohydrolase [Oceanobacillus iheyensis]|uniref:amidohydrolase n=1 Tax=Oceanobacillus iheyensis TaxID=182710 RepID=UPI0036325F42
MIKLYINGVIHTFQSSNPIVEAVAVENNCFIDIGTTKDMLLNWKAKSSEIIDLQGLTVTPGLTDSHLHLSMVASKFVDLDVTGVTSKQDMLEYIRRHSHTLKPGEWLLGSGWDENLFTDGGIPTLDELDQVAPLNPLYITRICEHAAVVNSKSFEAINYSEDISVPEGGKIVVDSTSLKPTGLILESASILFQEHIPEKSYETWKNALRKTIKATIQHGITSVHSNDPLYLGGLKQTYQLFDELLNKEQLGLRTNLLINHEFLEELEAMNMYTGYGNDTLQIGAIKIFADGAFGRRTALLREPYQDSPSQYGEAMFSQETLYDIVRRARERGMPVAVHTIGDQALINVLDILDQFPPSEFRDRLIHVQVVNDNLVKRLASNHRIADIQPRFLASDYPWVKDRLGEERMPMAYAWKTLLDNGVICGGGSDAPVEPMNPLLGIHAAVTRRAPGEDHEGWYKEQKLSMYEAFRLFTEQAAYTTNEEHKKGTIEPGKLADMTVYSNNPFQMSHPDDLFQTSIEMTIIGGEIKYSR